LNLNTDTVGDIYLAYPPTEEQQHIVAFLDRETSRIDSLIAKKERQIELLQEKRTALVAHATTKGINPNIKMMNSCVEWLGKVPRHWIITPLKRAAMFQRGHDLPDAERREGSIPIVSSAGVTGTHDEYRAIGPGLVTGRYGTIGVFHYIEGEFWPLNTTLYCVNTWGNNVRFLWYLLQNLSPLFLMNSTKSAVPGVDRNDLHTITVAVPPSLDEQKEIACFLDHETSMIEKLLGKIRQSIDILHEYRAALISAAVTGKIDVREEVAVCQPSTGS
jgi:type I restriction enzyme S subunit